ncbi:pilus assembly PilX N-terminal domain-containing protein [uncultured Phascolarctobacterium sp.]|uniref:pilus assembly PilX family protein n=1 Tax=uncultured Phascolarctobacterium sp. TaxID=512296 RepID=UPI0015B2617F|nr:pilus assembly PilX N-terminal domain-containing protein [uncultured Phascolarctobacterium sp.]
MKSQRGSVTVIAVVMLLFLMIIAVAWLPMMTMEKTAASSDYREQQAWYAAEAGYKRAVAALENKNNEWWWITPENYIQTSDSMNLRHLSLDGNKVDQEKIWYAVGIMKGTLDISGTYTPEDNVAYQITSIGSCQGIRKVIRKVYTLGDNGETGGGEEGGGEEVLDLPGLIQSGGKVTVKNSNNTIIGSIYGSDKEDQSGDKHFNNGDNWQGNYTGALKTKIPDNVFEKSFYTNIKTLDVLPVNNNEAFVIGDKEQVYIEWPIGYYKDEWNKGNNWNYQIRGGSGAVLFINCPKNNNSLYLTNGIIGPSSGAPLTLVFDGNVIIITPLQGNIRIFAKGSVKLDSSNSGNPTNNEELLMVMANGDIDMARPWGTVNGKRYAFLSSNANVILENSCNNFCGQIQAQGNVIIWSSIAEYSNKVLKAPGFTVPKGMS